MASKQTGVAVIYGFPGGVSWTGIGTAAFFNESGDFEAPITVDEVRDEDNELRTLIHSGETIDGTLQFTPRAPTGTNTKAAAANSLPPPAPGSKVTLGAAVGGGAVDFALGIANAADWVYVGGWRVAFRKNGVATYELKIRRSRNNDISAAVT